MSIDSCFFVTEDTLIVNENDPGAIIFKKKDEIFIKQGTYYLEHQMEKLL